MESKLLVATIILASGAQSMVLPDGTLQLAPLDAHASEWVSIETGRRDEPKHEQPQRPNQDVSTNTEH